MSPLALAKGAVDVTFGTQPGIEGARGRVTLEDDTIRLTDFELKAPADALRTLAPSPAPWRAGGEWIIDAASFRYGANRAEGALNARWQRARLATGVYALDLGTLTVHFASQGSALAGTLANIGGDAKIDGNIAIAASGMTLNLNIAPGPGVAPDIARMLAALGTVDANGVVHAQWRTGK